jgi:H+/Cl- antiporter ClcA
VANGCVEQKVSKEEFLNKSEKDMIVCLFDVVSDIQKEVKLQKKWSPLKTAAYMFCTFAGGTFGIFIIHLFKISPL